MRLPDFEAWAIFAKVAQRGSFAKAAAELGLSKATVSKAVARLEARLGVSLIHRTSRRMALTETGRAAAADAQRILEDGEAAERQAGEGSRAPRGLVRLAAPMSFGLAHLAPLLPDLLSAYPGLSIDLHLGDAQVDLVAEGFDLALRIAALADSTLRARRICAVRRLLVGAPAYFRRFGRPQHPEDLRQHACLDYAYLPRPGAWRFADAAGRQASVATSGPLRANNADALTPALLAGLGVAVQPEFTVFDDLAAGRLEAVMGDWAPPPIALNILLPPGPLRPARVALLIDALTARLRGAAWARDDQGGGEARGSGHPGQDPRS